MANRKFAGRGMREFYMPITGQGKTTRRNRKDCKNYNPETGFCFKLWTSCVGPAMCGKFQSNKE